MRYRIARGAQVFGPYTGAEVQRYLRSGHILPGDLAQLEGSAEWLPLPMVFPLAETWTQAGTASGRPYPDPPDLPWLVALLLGVITGGIFFVVWDIVQASWLRRVQPASQALALYLGIAVLWLLRLPFNWDSIRYNLFDGPPVGPHHGFLMFLVWLGLFLASRIVLRRELLEHFHVEEPMSLQLNAFLMFLLGGLYVQYHFNRINERKRAMGASMPAV